MPGTIEQIRNAKLLLISSDLFRANMKSTISVLMKLRIMMPVLPWWVSIVGQLATHQGHSQVGRYAQAV